MAPESGESDRVIAKDKGDIEKRRFWKKCFKSMLDIIRQTPIPSEPVPSHGVRRAMNQIRVRMA